MEAGPKGAVLSFHQNRFANPAGLVDFLQAQAGTAKLRTDQKLVVMRSWETDKERLTGVRRLLEQLVKVAEAPPPEVKAPAPTKPPLVKTRAAR